jgi:hypothetical protein
MLYCFIDDDLSPFLERAGIGWQEDGMLVGWQECVVQGDKDKQTEQVARGKSE